MKQYLLGFALVLALIGCAQKGAEQKNTSQDHNDQEIFDSSKVSKDSKQSIPLTTENSVSLFNGDNIFISKEKNNAGKYDLRAVIDKIEFKGTSDKNNGSGSLEALKADKSKIKISISDDLNSVTTETYDAGNKKVSSKVIKKQGLLTEENFKANKLDSKKITRSNDTTLEYTEMTDAENAVKAVETLKNSIKFEGNLVGNKTSVSVTEGTVTLTREIQDGKLKIFLNDTASGSNKKTATWQETAQTLTITVDSKKTKNLVFLSDGTITVQNYDSNGTNLEGKPKEIKDLAELKAALK
ncbi:outer surface lipoprotein OspB [Borreliella japonica]|uniref:outer surface lipoprotein OspB n=1 Tax=Borreliella japonica TaxID=34095 RepID=UPI00264794A0|nr:outer surface lipoprotein OspB [Borreliella japonica]WKC87653.1 outer surface lipoprotein OspB [Borreliella japonica]